MPHVGLYCLSADRDALLLFVCRLTEKAFLQGYDSIHIRAPDPDCAAAIDRTLWSFRAESFVPHILLSDAKKVSVNYPVRIGTDTPPQGMRLLLHLGAMTAPLPECERIAEIFDAAQDGDARIEERMRFYQEQGCEPQKHLIKA